VVVPDATAGGVLIPMIIAVDNDLSPDGLKLLNRAEQSAGNPNVTVLAWIDGPGDGDSYLYRVQADQHPACPNFANPTCDGRYTLGQNFWQMPERIADPYSVAEFLKGALLAYPTARQVIPVLVGHGSGISAAGLAGQPSRHRAQPDPLAGLLADAHPQGTALSTRALGRALRWSLQAAQAAGAERTAFDGLFLDACLMNMFEVGYEIHDSVDLLLGSESMKWTTFPYDEHLTAITKDQSARQILEQWFLHEVNQLQGDSDYPYTYAVIDLTQMPALSTAVDQLATTLTATLPAGKPRIDAALQDIACFDSNADGTLQAGVDNYCDLHSLAQALATAFTDNSAIVSAAQAVQEQVATSVIAESHQGGTPWIYPDQTWQWKTLGGMSIYLPFDQDEWKRSVYLDEHFRSVQEGQWDAFLNAYWNTSAPAAPACPPTCGLPSRPIALKAALQIYLPLVQR
jgi:hypothetical protein